MTQQQKGASLHKAKENTVGSCYLTVIFKILIENPSVRERTIDINCDFVNFLIDRFIGLETIHWSIILHLVSLVATNCDCECLLY